MSCDLYAALEQLYSSGLYSCVVELYPFVGASQTLSAAEAANGALYQVCIAGAAYYWTWFVKCICTGTVPVTVFLKHTNIIKHLN